MRSTIHVLLLVLLAGLAACGRLHPELAARIEREASVLQPPVTDDPAVVRTAEQTAAGARDHPPPLDLPAAAGLEDYVRAALSRNPEIRAAIRRVQALGYRIPQVTSLDDPVIRLIPPTGDLTETAAGAVQAQIGISQAVPYPGKLRSRGRIAEQEVRMALADLTDVRVRIAADVARAYYAYYLADVSARITRDSARLLEQIRDVASARYRAGSATQQDVLRTEVELYSLINETITHEQRRSAAAARLNSLLDRPVDAPLPRPAPFDLAAVEWRLPEAIDRAVRDNPRLAHVRDEIRRDLEAIRLARQQYLPDFSLGFGYSLIGGGLSPVATGSDNWSLPVGLTLPIWWQRIRAGILEANARALTDVERYQALRNVIFFGLQDTLVKIDTEYRRAVLFRDLLIPRAWQTVEVSTAAYRAGELEYTALIDNWRKWLDFSLAYHGALARLEQRFADLQQLIGARIARRPGQDGSPASETRKESQP